MQPISKIEQPTSPSSISNYYSPPNSTKDLMQSITKFLENGQQSALQVRNILNKRLGFKVEGDTCDDDHEHVLDHHTCVTLSSFETCLSMIKRFDLDHHFDDDDDDHLIKKRKLDHTTTSSDVECSDHSSKSQQIVDGGPKVSRERRGCYKRRRTGQTWTVEANNLVDDGFAWRKYGQKEILHTKYPRNYFRCTHKHDQECQATKQVQQISENPTKYTITYHGHHTCKNLLKTPSIIIDGSQEENSSFFLSFDTKTHPPSKHALTTPSLFFSSSSAFLNNNSPTIVKQEHTPIKIETPSAPHDLDRDRDHDHRAGSHIQHQYSSSSDNHPPSSSLSDLTSTGISSTPVSEQGDVISSSSADQFYNMDDEELFNLINMNVEYPPLDDGFWNNICAS